VQSLPDFIDFVDTGAVTLSGCAWWGSASVAGVEVGVEARSGSLPISGPPFCPYAWRSWSWVWQTELGDRVLSLPAVDANGNRQPLEPFWNLQGMGNNCVQLVPVTVR
jgi:hypothetical protein